MNLKEAVKTRHSVRQYQNKALEAEVDLDIVKQYFEIGAGKIFSPGIRNFNYKDTKNLNI